ncbi:oxidoreductase C-terminal domain-containing protein [Streptomyces sp. NPDC002677]|uniref:oxidoreductase C-terminal domain-containing protein n=1 Tax=Streptomyces sp. NPDC002677 TaxID=3154774 RepID=UPI003316E33B
MGGVPGRGNFSVLRFREGALSAVESVNSPADHMAARRILTVGPALDMGRAAHLGFDLRAWSRRRPVGQAYVTSLFGL